ncbi:DUF1289 domain-containing protein [Vibrio tapetis subsp. quintayensis]|uniref:DUF1289 domain-containing protein n=1 Tax=Vibrio tapetis TaxID=52443 RepID=UPI0025B3EC06|nr:DUF1289 domain-containing protein [Vibrio tapetis]MDN3682413.1 DUF1289 domain-containing protein [Vibrio tapetis subsp. quintayensis]
MKKNKSPSIDLCDFSNAKGWCLGCGRTRKECQQWKAMTPYSANILKNELRKRMLKIKTKMNN